MCYSLNDASAFSVQSGALAPARKRRSPRPQSSRHCRSTAPGWERTPGARAPRRAPGHPPAAGCWPRRRRRCRRCARQHSAPRRTAGRAASRRRRAGSWRRCRRSPRSGSGASADRPSDSRRVVTCRSTDVFSPLKLKSRRPGRCGALRSACVSRVFGNGIARSLPVGARDGRSPARRDSRARAASPPCRTPPPPHRRACGRAARTRPALGTRYRLVWPPETTSTTAGSGSSPCSSTSDSMWPAR